jgi:hypothetical protein
VVVVVALKSKIEGIMSERQKAREIKETKERERESHHRHYSEMGASILKSRESIICKYDIISNLL